MHLSVAVAKVDKWAVLTGGDTLEMIERPHGGVSLVLADGQSSGKGKKIDTVPGQCIFHFGPDIAGDENSDILPS